jgi:hypothetical protein
MMCAYRSRRRSAVVRSPSQETSANRQAVAQARAATTANMVSAAAFSDAVLWPANPWSISWRTPWPIASSRPVEASRATAAPATCHR